MEVKNQWPALLPSDPKLEREVANMDLNVLGIASRETIAGELGVTGIVPPNDEYMLYWDFSFGWAPLDGELTEGPAMIRLLIDKAGQAWRQVKMRAWLSGDGRPSAPYGPMISMLPTRGVLIAIPSATRASKRFLANSICSGVMPGRQQA